MPLPFPETRRPSNPEVPCFYLATPSSRNINQSTMATAAVVVPSASRVEPGSHTLLAATLPVAEVDKEVDANEVVQEWLKKFQDVLDHGDYKNKLPNLFLKEAYWRDQLCLSWNYRRWTLDFLGCRHVDLN